MQEPVPFASLRKGDVFPDFALTLSDGQVAAYLDATGEDPTRWAGRVPPVMLSALMIGGLLERVGDPGRVMHTGQEHEQRRAVATGEPLTVRIVVAQRTERRGAVIAAFDAEARAGDGVVATAHITVLLPAPAEVTPS